MPANHTEVEKRLWEAADELRANSKLKSSEYSVPVLGLIFLRYADHKFAEAEKKLTAGGNGRRKIGKTDYQAQGVLFIPEKARFANLLNLPEGGRTANQGQARTRQTPPAGDTRDHCVLPRAGRRPRSSHGSSGISERKTEGRCRSDVCY
jgi:type I restriction-modification system DNA methylase subunit